MTSKAGEINKNVEFHVLDILKQVDKSAEVTKINIRLHNGEIVSQEFNITHTVNDIYLFVQR